MSANSSAQATNTALNNLNALPNIVLTQPLVTKNLTIGSGSTVTFDDTLFSYSGEADYQHRQALGLTSLSTAIPAASITEFLEYPSSTNLRNAIVDETGTGSLVFADQPTIISPTITGTVQFTSTTSRPTSAGTPTLADNSLITRADGDSRFGQMLASVLSADSAGVIFSTIHVDSGLELSLTAGKWVITGTAIQTAGNSSSGSRLKFLLSRSSNVAGVIFYANGALASTATSSNILGTSTFFDGYLVAATTAYYNWSFIVHITDTTTIKVQYAQAAATGGQTTIVKMNSHIMARKLQ
jgi:hypothetical protein